MESAGSGGGGDDARKKRDCGQVMASSEHIQDEEKPKKLRFQQLSTKLATTTTASSSAKSQQRPKQQQEQKQPQNKQKQSTQYNSIAATSTTLTKIADPHAISKKEGNKKSPYNNCAEVASADQNEECNYSTNDFPSRFSQTCDIAMMASSKLKSHSTTRNGSGKMTTDQPNLKTNTVWDLESALNYVVHHQVPVESSELSSTANRDTNGRTCCDDDNGPREYLWLPFMEKADPQKERTRKQQQSHHDNNKLATSSPCWVSFRVGHAGDASTIANWYRKSQREKQREREQDRQQKQEFECPEQLKQPPPQQARTQQQPHQRQSPISENEIHPLNPSSDMTHNTSSTSLRMITGGNQISTFASTPSSSTEEESSGMLEMWLADGMGDEDTLPSVYCLLAHVHSESTASHDDDTKNAKDSNQVNPECISGIASATTSAAATTTTAATIASQLGAVALVTMAWMNGGERVLTVEWIHIDQSLEENIGTVLEQRMWLRLSMVALMTACDGLIVEDELLQSRYSSEKTNGISSKRQQRTNREFHHRFRPSAE